MERKDYADMFRDIKNDILAEIRSLIPEDSAHHFNEKFYVHYIEGEVATTEICSAVEHWYGGMVAFIVHRKTTAEEEVIESEEVFGYDSNSFLDILEHLKKDLREKKLSRLRDLVRKNGWKIDFDGSFGFNSLVDENHVAGEKSMVTCIELDNSTGKRIYLDCNMSGEIMEEQEENIPFDQLDALIAYVESQIKRKFTIRVSGSFSRTFEIEASSYEDALAEAKKDWLVNPLCYNDSNGENWDGYQHDEK